MRGNKNTVIDIRLFFCCGLENNVEFSEDSGSCGAGCFGNKTTWSFFFSNLNPFSFKCPHQIGCWAWARETDTARGSDGSCVRRAGDPCGERRPSPSQPLLPVRRHRRWHPLSNQERDGLFIWRIKVESISSLPGNVLFMIRVCG